MPKQSKSSKASKKTTTKKSNKTKDSKKKTKKQKEEKVKIDITQHILVPKHEILSEEEKEELLKKLNVDLKQLPKIKITDPAIRHLNPKPGDIVKITRKSPTAEKVVYYRSVIE